MSIYTVLNPVNETNLAVKYAGIQIQMNHNQYEYNDCILSFNGIIHNASVLCQIENIEYKCDEETILILYKKYGIDQLLVMLDGIFVFVLYDYFINVMESRVYVARSASGLIPIYIQTVNTSFVIKSGDVSSLGTLLKSGMYIEFMIEFQVSAEWKYMDKQTFHTIPRTAFHPSESLGSIFVMIDPKIFQDRDTCMRRIFQKCGFHDSRLFVLADTNPYSIYMIKQMDLMGILYDIVEPSDIDDIVGKGRTGIDVRGMTFLSCSYSETSEIGEDRICREYFTDLQDSIARGNLFGSIQYPFLDILWIEFYMTLRPKWRKRIFNV